jgi:CrcB protein
MLLLLIALGGAAGAVARYGLDGWVQNATGPSFPWGTMLINVSGSFLLGIVVRLLEGLHASPSWRAALAIGFCGAYTTFSTFSFETARLLQHRQWTLAIGNILGNLLLSLFAIFLGFGAAHWLLQARR